MEFKDIIGQENLKRVLINSLNEQQISHAYIFCGEDGLGKKTMAKIFSKKLLCKNMNKSDCKCKSCMVFENETHPDFFNIKKDGNSIGVDKIRQMQSQIVVSPIYGAKKIFLINDAEKLTKEAQNALLKIMEEPPHYVVIMLVTNNSNMLLETIRSRAIQYNFSKNTRDEVRKYLETKYGENISNINFLISCSDGKIGKVVEIMNTDDINQIRDVVIDYASKIKLMKMNEILNAIDFFTQNKDRIELLLNMMTMFFRDLLILKQTKDYELLTNIDKRDILIHRMDEFSCRELIRNIETITEATKYIRRNVNFGLLLEVMFLKLQEE